MFDHAHRQIAITTGVGVSIACAAPLAGAVVITLACRAMAMVPDHSEKWFLVKRKNHRTWTHWMITAVLFGIIIGAILYGIGYASSVFVLEHLNADTVHEYRKRRELSDALLEGGYIMGFLIGLGATCGALTHVLTDACTVGGVPLLGPFSRRKRWIVPKEWRIEVGDKEKEKKGKPFQPTNGEKLWVLIANITTIILIAYVAAPTMIEIYDKYSNGAPS